MYKLKLASLTGLAVLTFAVPILASTPRQNSLPQHSQSASPSSRQLRPYEVDPNQLRPANCDPSYPDANMCIPVGTPDINCSEIPHFKNFTVYQPDPHGFDRDKTGPDGIGCEK